ncbi:MAG TPA: hypothetical protein VL635_20835 [Trinickia sp.]|jgi:hypothetical protein|nr:hypothetical protein [Trinickia sp.]
MLLHAGLGKPLLSEIVAVNYNIAVQNPGQLVAIQRFTERVLVEVVEACDHFAPIVNRNMPALLRLLKSASMDALVSLRHVNTAFQIGLLEFPGRVAMPRWMAFGDACSRVPIVDRLHLKEFYARRASRPLDNQILSTEEIFHTARGAGLGAEALGVMKSTAEYSPRSAQGGALPRDGTAGVTRGAIVALARMWRAHPPMSRFMDGFTEWGPGDSRNSADVNLERHCEKHVLYQEVGPNYGAAEPTQWWEILNVNLTWMDYERLARNPLPQCRAVFDGDRPLRGDALKKFLFYHGGLRSEPELTRFLKDQALPRYREFSIARSRGMDNALVQSDGESVFISGSSGPAFIIGRYEGVQLGISSCYLPEPLTEKLAGARKVMAWPLR